MKLGPLGTREVVGLAVLAVAVITGLAVTFFRREDQAQFDAAAAVSLERTLEANPKLRTQTARAAPTETRVPEKTATPSPNVQIKPPAEWQLNIQELSASGAVISDIVRPQQGLDLTYDRVPFNDFKDNSWRLVAQSVLEAETAGNWKFTIEYQGEISVQRNGEEIAKGSSPGKVAKLEVSFLTTETRETIGITVRDVGEKLTLRWK